MTAAPGAMDPRVARDMWKMTPASFASRLSRGSFKTWHYTQLLSRKMVDVALGRTKRLVVTMPPRHGKSTMASLWTPAWYLEMFPDRLVMLTSAESDFAATWGGKVRDVFLANEDLLDARLVGKPPAKDEWYTTEGGGMKTAGVGGMITGRGAHLLVVDDYVKDAQAAWSPTIRENTWDWWTSTSRTRLEPGASVVVLATRWHSDDLIGRLIDSRRYDPDCPRDDWEVFVLPALADLDSEDHYRQRGVVVNDLRAGLIDVPRIHDPTPDDAASLARGSDPEWRDILGRRKGEALCPERYPEHDLAVVRGASRRDWFAMYQCRPGDEADSGNAYPQFLPERNCRPLHRDFTMQLFASIDFGVEPIVAVVGQHDLLNGQLSAGRVDVLLEVWLKSGTIGDLMAKLVAELQPLCWGRQTVEFFGDAAGTTRSSQSHLTSWQIVEQHLAAVPWIRPVFRRLSKNPPVVDRINAVNSALHSPDGDVHLRVDQRRCPQLVLDFKRVKWAEDNAGNALGQLDKGDKWRTHVSDAVGYAIERLLGLRRRGRARSGIMQ